MGVRFQYKRLSSRPQKKGQPLEIVPEFLIGRAKKKRLKDNKPGKKKSQGGRKFFCEYT